MSAPVSQRRHIMYTIQVDGATLYRGADALAALLVYLRYVRKTYRAVTASRDGHLIASE